MLISDDLATIITIVVPLVELLGIAAAGHAIMNARTSQAAIAWGVSLVTFPWLALWLYAIFGRNQFKGYALLRQSRDKAVYAVLEKCQKQIGEKNLTIKKLSGPEKVFTQLGQLPILRGNQSELLIDGDETFRSIFDGIDSAKDYILVMFYIIKDDTLGRQFKSKLIQKAKENVRVYFLFDEIGSYGLPKSYLRDMQREGIVAKEFNTTRGKTNRFQLNFRNHRKIVVIDGQTAYVGGHNVGDEYVSRHPKFGAWRDTHVKVTGPIVKAIQLCFTQDWYWATEYIADLNWELNTVEHGPEEMLMIASGPADTIETCGLMFVQAINMARKRIWIASPYFVPDLQVLSALKLAALRGVDVRILIPEKPDHRTVYLASFFYYPNTLEHGVKLYRYTTGFMHQKVLLIDSTIAAVGTANLDNRSFRLNFELTLLNFDPTFSKRVAVMLRNDFAHSRVAKLTDYTQRSFFFRLAVRFASLFSPIL